MTDPIDQAQTQASDSNDDYIAVAVPVHVRLESRQSVVSLDEAEEILRRATSIALGPCGCRKDAGRCDAPIDTCLALNRTDEELAGEWEGFAPVTIERALEALRLSHDAGLVHLAYRKPGREITEFCSCCSCCCWMFQKLRESAFGGELIASGFVAEHDQATCIGCGACVDRCHFDAWAAARNGGKPTLDPARCLGCGVCVPSCPAGAISFVARST